MERGEYKFWPNKQAYGGPPNPMYISLAELERKLDRIIALLEKMNDRQEGV